MKYIAIVLFVIICTPVYIKANGVTDTIQSPFIDILEDNQESMNLNQVLIVDSQLDLVLQKVTSGLDEKSSLCFYITLMEYEDKLYIEMFEDYPNSYLFEIKNKSDSLSQRLNRNIYGYVKYNNIDIYLLLYLDPYKPNKGVLDNLICKTNNQITIFQNPKEFFFIQENPMWLYEYLDGNMNLIKSVNDKGFFSNP